MNNDENMMITSTENIKQLLTENYNINGLNFDSFTDWDSLTKEQINQSKDNNNSMLITTPTINNENLFANKGFRTNKDFFIKQNNLDNKEEISKDSSIQSYTSMYNAKNKKIINNETSLNYNTFYLGERLKTNRYKNVHSNTETSITSVNMTNKIITKINSAKKRSKMLNPIK